MHGALPKYRFTSILDIKPEDFHKMGAKAIAFDFDNTTVYDSRLRLKKGADKWVNQMKEAGFPIMAITNTGPLRARLLAKKFDVDYISTARKPDPKAFFEAARRMKVDIANLAMIGDKVFKDIQGANTAGAISILVKPFMIEKFLYLYYYKIRKREEAFLKEHKIEW